MVWWQLLTWPWAKVGFQTSFQGSGQPCLNLPKMWEDGCCIKVSQVIRCKDPYDLDSSRHKIYKSFRTQPFSYGSTSAVTVIISPPVPHLVDLSPSSLLSGMSTTYVVLSVIVYTHKDMLHGVHGHMNTCESVMENGRQCWSQQHLDRTSDPMLVQGWSLVYQSFPLDIQIYTNFLTKNKQCSQS